MVASLCWKKHTVLSDLCLWFTVRSHYDNTTTVRVQASVAACERKCSTVLCVSSVSCESLCWSSWYPEELEGECPADSKWRLIAVQYVWSLSSILSLSAPFLSSLFFFYTGEAGRSRAPKERSGENCPPFLFLSGGKHIDRRFATIFYQGKKIISINVIDVSYNTLK